VSDVSTIQDTMQSKICDTCKENLPLDKYHIAKTSRLGKHNICKQCRSNSIKKLNYAPRTEGEKLCAGSICNGKMKPVSEFYKSKAYKDGLQVYCNICSCHNGKVCASTYDGFMTKLFNTLKNNCLNRAKDLAINITIDNIKDQFTKQKGLCALTGKTLTYSYMKENAHQGNCQLKYRWNISVDRIDSSKGYDKDNIQLVGAIINRMKTDLNDQKFIELCQSVTKYHDLTDENRYINGLDSSQLDLNIKSYESDLFLKYIFSNLINNNINRPKTFAVNINIDDIILLYKSQRGLCALTGIPLTLKKKIDRKGEDSDHCHIQNIWNLSVDRIDSSKGYEIDNIQLLGAIINRMKLDLPEEDFIEVCRLF
jgi:hypothetical protein